MQAAMKGLFAGTAQKQYEKLQRLNFNIFASIRFNMIRYLPKALQCCCLKPKDKRDRIIKRSYKEMLEEVKIANILKKLRALEAIMKDQF